MQHVNLALVELGGLGFILIVAGIIFSEINLQHNIINAGQGFSNLFERA
jgi:hypothetical protein